MQRVGVREDRHIVAVAQLSSDCPDYLMWTLLIMGDIQAGMALSMVIALISVVWWKGPCQRAQLDSWHAPWPAKVSGINRWASQQWWIMKNHQEDDREWWPLRERIRQHRTYHWQKLADFKKKEGTSAYRRLVSGIAQQQSLNKRSIDGGVYNTRQEPG